MKLTIFSALFLITVLIAPFQFVSAAPDPSFRLLIADDLVDTFGGILAVNPSTVPPSAGKYFSDEDGLPPIDVNEPLDVAINATDGYVFVVYQAGGTPGVSYLYDDDGDNVGSFVGDLPPPTPAFVEFSFLTGIAVDGTDVYVADAGEFAPFNGNLTKYVVNPLTNEYEWDWTVQGPIQSAQDVAIDPFTNKIWVLDPIANTIFEIESGGDITPIPIFDGQPHNFQNARQMTIMSENVALVTTGTFLDNSLLKVDLQSGEENAILRGHPKHAKV